MVPTSSFASLRPLSLGMQNAAFGEFFKLNMGIRYIALSILAAQLGLASASASSPLFAYGPAQGNCGMPGEWLVPPNSPAMPPTRAERLRKLFEELAGRKIVLLGECHDCADDHRWELQMLSAMQQLHPDLAIGFEMFPRRDQQVLDRWVAGQLTEAEFLRQAEWDKVWSYDPEFYLPLFRFARQYHLPMLALNIDSELAHQVRSIGWDSVPQAQREGVGQPASPDPAYRTELQEIFDTHPSQDNQKDRSVQFNHFVEAQSLWDRAMAEAIASFHHLHPETLVVGIMGSGHLRNGYGVPHQLRALGVRRIASLVTIPSDHPCSEITPGLADAVFVIPPQPQQVIDPPPRLGVSLSEVEGGVKIEEVIPGSLAEKSGLQAGDILLQAAGNKVGSIHEMQVYVQRQPAGTAWPLLIQRGPVTLTIVVRFPAQVVPGITGAQR
jgi:uncharacterized iron-regulated protein